jgi:hypothetical protein
MRIISQSKTLEAKVFAATVVAQVEALAHDAQWQATLAALRERHPNGVMHP